MALLEVATSRLREARDFVNGDSAPSRVHPSYGGS